MMLKYIKIDITIKFDKEIEFYIYPTFIFRSVLGKELKRLVCLFKGRKCPECPIKYTCAYSYVFETPIEKNNQFLKGRDRASHPFVLSSDTVLGAKTDHLNLYLTLFGKGIDYFPYIYYSLLQAGKKGIFKERIKFTLNSAEIDGASIIDNENNINMDFERKEWFLQKSGQAKNIKLLITFLSPLRLKYQGSYGTDFSFDDFLVAAKRRCDVLCGLYGKIDKEDMVDNFLKISHRIIKRNIKWMDLNYYSARQKSRLKMGGVSGSILVEGNFSTEELSFLEAGELFHVGKNPGFGLGKIKVEEVND